MEQLGLAPRRRERAMRGLTDHRSIVAIGNDQPRLAWQIALFVKDPRQERGDRPVESIAIFKIITPFPIADEVSLSDLDLDDGQAALRINRHEVGAAAIGQR